MTKSTSEIRSEWIAEWREAAEEDDATWLKKVVGQPDADPEELIEGMNILFEYFPVEEPTDDTWNPNYLLEWQQYGFEPADKYLVIVRLHGTHHAILFSEPDSLDRIPFQALFEELETERVVVENYEPDIETNRDAVAFIEEALGLTPPLATGQTALPWDGDAERFILKLSDCVRQKIERTY
jgi:hypothetical protein